MSPDPTPLPSETAPSLRPVDELHRLVDEIVMAPGWREALRAAVAAADRENAELRGEVERLRELVRANASAVLTFERERNSARAQLAAAQAQLAEARQRRTAAVRAVMDRGDAFAELYAERDQLRARLEAVRAACDAAASDPDESEWVLVADVLAALSAAPQPEADDVIEARFQQARREAHERYDDEPPASDEPARTPDLMAALRVSVEAAKKRRTASDTQARCKHGFTEAHDFGPMHDDRGPVPSPWCSGPAGQR